MHWGQNGQRGGSEHSVGSKFFPGELQIFGFNADLYKNLSHAFGNPSGAVAIAVMIKEAERGVNGALSDIVQYARKVRRQSCSSFQTAFVFPAGVPPCSILLDHARETNLSLSCQAFLIDDRVRKCILLWPSSGTQHVL